MNVIHNQDCIVGMRALADKSVDCILTDPPYKYLKNQKLEVDFDETAFFAQAQRVLKPNGFIVLFGRGTSFYRWNTMLSDLGFNFKEEIVWDKSYCTSPLMALSRVHETISIHTKGKGVINRIKVPYLEMKKHDIGKVIQDINRMKTILKNTKSLNAVLAYLENNVRDTSDVGQSNNLTISSTITKEDRSAWCMRAINHGLNEKTIIRTDRYDCDTITKHQINIANHPRTGDRSVNAVNSIVQGMNEKTIIRELGNRYKAVHPTQKPVRLLERLLALVTQVGDLVLDPFSGSGATAIACINTDRRYIGYEIDAQYHRLSVQRLADHTKQISNTTKYNS